MKEDMITKLFDVKEVSNGSPFKSYLGALNANRSLFSLNMK
jgi:hypothetical protein